MPLSLTLASLCVFAAAAMFPMRWHYGPRLVLLILAGPLLVLVWRELGWVWVSLVLAAVLSMFPWPLLGLARHPRHHPRGSA